MEKSTDHHHNHHGGRTNLASCLLATAFLLLGFAAANGTLHFTFDQYASVRNPNHAAFSHYDSTLQLVYAGRQVGFMFIPAGQIAGGHTQYMAASFSVDAFPLGAAGAAPAPLPGAAFEVESRLRVKGRVRVLRFFTHHVEATADCRVGVAAPDGSVLGFRC